MGGPCMGLVVVYDSYTKTKKGYLGFGLGDDVGCDIDRVVSYGAKFGAEDVAFLVNCFNEVVKTPPGPQGRT